MNSTNFCALIQKANEEQTQKLAKLNEEQTESLIEDLRKNLKNITEKFQYYIKSKISKKRTFKSNIKYEEMT